MSGRVGKNDDYDGAWAWVGCLSIGIPVAEALSR